jgi:hypothetical protein
VNISQRSIEPLQLSNKGFSVRNNDPNAQVLGFLKVEGAFEAEHKIHIENFGDAAGMNSNVMGLLICAALLRK